MPRIARPSVRPNLATISNLGLAALRVGSPFAGMAIPTQALQRAQQEAVPVAVMRLDMVGDCGGDDMAMLAADPAQGLEPKLTLRSLAPALQRIRISPGRCLRGSGRKLGQEAKRRCHEAFGRFALCRRRVVSGFRAWRLLFLPADFVDAFEPLDRQTVLSHTRYHGSSACFRLDRLDRVGGDRHDHLSPEQRDQYLSQIPPRACVSPFPAIERPETNPNWLAH
jgi:hypothetical protein